MNIARGDVSAGVERQLAARIVTPRQLQHAVAFAHELDVRFLQVLRSSEDFVTKYDRYDCLKQTHKFSSTADDVDDGFVLDVFLALVAISEDQSHLSIFNHFRFAFCLAETDGRLKIQTIEHLQNIVGRARRSYAQADDADAHLRWTEDVGTVLVDDEGSANADVEVVVLVTKQPVGSVSGEAGEMRWHCTPRQTQHTGK